MFPAGTLCVANSRTLTKKNNNTANVVWVPKTSMKVLAKDLRSMPILFNSLIVLSHCLVDGSHEQHDGIWCGTQPNSVSVCQCCAYLSHQ